MELVANKWKLVNWITQLFQGIIDFIFSANAVTIGMLFLAVARSIETQKLFMFAYPTMLQGDAREVAAWLMAIGIEWTVTIVTVNSKYTTAKATKIFASSSVVMSILFFRPLEAFPLWDKAITVIYLSAVSGYALYSYCEIFVKRATEKIKELDMSMLIENLRTELTKLKSKSSSDEQLVNSLKNELTDLLAKQRLMKEQVNKLTTENAEMKGKLSRTRKNDAKPELVVCSNVG
jgi:hypothetical protein